MALVQIIMLQGRERCAVRTTALGASLMPTKLLIKRPSLPQVLTSTVSAYSVQSSKRLEHLPVQFEPKRAQFNEVKTHLATFAVFKTRRVLPGKVG